MLGGRVFEGVNAHDLVETGDGYCRGWVGSEDEMAVILENYGKDTSTSFVAW